MFPLTATTTAAVAWKGAMFLFPPLVEQDPYRILSGSTEKRIAAPMEKRKKKSQQRQKRQ